MPCAVDQVACATFLDAMAAVAGQCRRLNRRVGSGTSAVGRLRAYPEHVNFAALTPLAWIYEVLDFALLIAAGWAFIDCIRRRPDAFPAVGRSSKGLWLVLTGLSAVYAVGGVLSASPPMGIIAIAAVVITAVYLLDIRPKIIEITSGH